MQKLIEKVIERVWLMIALILMTAFGIDALALKKDGELFLLRQARENPFLVVGGAGLFALCVLLLHLRRQRVKAWRTSSSPQDAATALRELPGTPAPWPQLPPALCTSVSQAVSEQKNLIITGPISTGKTAVIALLLERIPADTLVLLVPATATAVPPIPWQLRWRWMRGSRQQIALVIDNLRNFQRPELDAALRRCAEQLGRRCTLIGGFTKSANSPGEFQEFRDYIGPHSTIEFDLAGPGGSPARSLQLPLPQQTLVRVLVFLEECGLHLCEGELDGLIKDIPGASSEHFTTLLEGKWLLRTQVGAIEPTRIARENVPLTAPQLSNQMIETLIKTLTQRTGAVDLLVAAGRGFAQNGDRFGLTRAFTAALTLRGGPPPDRTRAMIHLRYGESMLNLCGQQDLDSEREEDPLPIAVEQLQLAVSYAPYAESNAYRCSLVEALLLQRKIALHGGNSARSTTELEREIGGHLAVIERIKIWRQTVASYRALLAQEPPRANSEISPRLAIEANLAVARGFLRAHRIQDAIPLLEANLRLQSSDIRTAYALALAYAEAARRAKADDHAADALKKNDRAIELLQIVTQYEPLHGRGFITTARTFLNRVDLVEHGKAAIMRHAEAALVSALELDPTNAEAHQTYGLLISKRFHVEPAAYDFDAAWTHLSTANQLNKIRTRPTLKQQTELLLIEAHLFSLEATRLEQPLVCQRERAGKLRATVAEILQSIYTGSPRPDPDLVLKLALILEQVGKLDAARTLYQRHHSELGHRTVFIVNFLRLLIRQRDWEGYRKHFEESRHMLHAPGNTDRLRECFRDLCGWAKDMVTAGEYHEALRLFSLAEPVVEHLQDRMLLDKAKALLQIRFSRTEKAPEKARPYLERAVALLSPHLDRHPSMRKHQCTALHALAKLAPADFRIAALAAADDLIVRAPCYFPGCLVAAKVIHDFRSATEALVLVERVVSELESPKRSATPCLRELSAETLAEARRLQRSLAPA